VKIMTTNTLRTELTSVCAQIVISDVVAPRAHRANGASAAASLLAAAKPAMFGRVETPLMPEPKTQIEQGGYASKPEFTTKKVDGLRGVPPRGRPV
jgi:hypothetical protein